MYLVRTPTFLQKWFPDFIWTVAEAERTVYLTFDDGPIPQITPWVMCELEKYDAKATFFCLGDNAHRNPGILDALRQAGHGIGNHTYDHPNGWRTDNSSYFRNVRKGAQAVQSELFRPPYGRLKPSQARFLSRHYKVVMWDILSGDFDTGISPEQCLRNVLDNVRPGSIIVFHDNLKAKESLEYALPKVLEELSTEGYVFKSLEKVGEVGGD